MNPPTIRLGYMSTAKRLLGPQDLERLLTKARARNKLLGITGMLLYSDGSFLQILEGPYDSVHQVFATIKLDPKHYQITTLFEVPATERCFEEWTMGFKEARLKDIGKVPGCNDILHEKGDLEEYIIKSADAGSTLQNIMMFFKAAQPSA